MSEESKIVENKDGALVTAVEETQGIVAASEEEDVNSEDSLTFSNGVIEKIVAIAVREVPGVVGMKGGLVNLVQDAFGARDVRKGVTVEVTPESIRMRKRILSTPERKKYDAKKKAEKAAMENNN